MAIGRWAAGAAAMLGAFAVARAAASGAKPGTSGPAARSGAQIVEERWTKAAMANDVDAIVACYAPDAVLWGPGDPEARGTEAIRASYRGMLADNVIRDVVLAHTRHKESGNVSAGWGNFTLTLAPKKGGAPVVVRGRFTEVVEKRGGEWLYVADHASADPPPAAK